MMSFYLSRIQATRVNAEEMLGLLVSTQPIELVIALAGRNLALLALAERTKSLTKDKIAPLRSRFSKLISRQRLWQIYSFSERMSNGRLSKQLRRNFPISQLSRLAIVNNFDQMPLLSGNFALKIFECSTMSIQSHRSSKLKRSATKKEIRSLSTERSTN